MANCLDRFAGDGIAQRAYHNAADGSSEPGCPFQNVKYPSER